MNMVSILMTGIYYYYYVSYYYGWMGEVVLNVC
jgi:hypothetical protein